MAKNGRKVKANKNNNRNGKESFYSNAINMLKPYYSQDDETTNIEIALRNIDTKTIINRIKKNMLNFGNTK